MKKHIVIMLCIVLAAVLCISCGGYEVTEIPSTAEKASVVVDKKVGVLMPNKTDERWEHDAENIQKILEQDGYQVEVRFAENNPYIQINQIEGLLKDNVDCLVISAVESEKLQEVLEKAKEKNVSVIAYDRMVMDTDAVSYYATFDNKNVGVSIGTYIKEKENLEQLRKEGKHRTIEFFMGSPDDNNAKLVYQGVMEVLGEYLQDGTLVCVSGKVEFEDTCIAQWSKSLAEKNANQILNNDYKDRKLDIACCANDAICSGVIASLERQEYSEEDWPMITGQDAEVEAIKYILSGKQSMSVYKDARVLADKCATMVKAVLEGTVPEINYAEGYDNGKMKVPSYLCTSVVVDKENYKEILVDGGYYTESQLK